MKFAAVALALLIAGCSAPAPEADAADPAPSEPLKAALPEAFAKTHEPSPGNLQLGVGGVVLSHDFNLATNATLHYHVAWDLPEPSVELLVLQGDEVVDGETVTAQAPGRLERTIELEPGAYTLSARLMGVGILKMFSVGGHFESAVADPVAQ